MISIYKAIKINDVDTISYLINLTSSSSHSSSSHTLSSISKDTQAWLLPYLKATNQKQYNLNRRSTLGKTPLHYAILWNRTEIAQKLIECPWVNINKRDLENGWSPLHRALYLGRMEIVWMLLKRDDLDLNIKDWEGYRALELFDTTINNAEPQLRKLKAPIMDQLYQTCTAKDSKGHSANYRRYSTTLSQNTDVPPPPQSSLEMNYQQRGDRQGGTDLYTWGMNTNYILGHWDTENRSRPERVPLSLESQQHTNNNLQRSPYVIESVHMSKFHMVILTSDSMHNLLVCGFGRGGRLGIGKDTDAQLAPVAVHWSERITAVALGRDHTIALTSSGSVITFGNNDYGQLGYDTEGRDDGYSMQLYPRKIQAPILKKQAIIGVAASKVHSVAYTSTELFTFGYNQGQLGYHHLGNSRRQATPRKVIYSSNILQVVATDFSTTILFENHDVISLANYETQKMTFLISRFPTNISVHSTANNYITKLVSSSTIYTGAISNMGDVYIWSCKSSSSVSDLDMKSEQQRSKQASIFTSTPRRIWTSARAEMMAVDASIGQDGEVIICTASGRVYIGGVTKEYAKEEKFKFQYVPQLQRCVYVCANPNGAYAAIRSEYQLPLPSKEPSTLASDLLRSLPCMKISSYLDTQLEQLKTNKQKLLDTLARDCIYTAQLDDTNDNDERQQLERKIEQDYKQRTAKLLDTTWKQMEQHDDPTLDVCFWIQGRPIYAHLCILDARRNKAKKSLFYQSHDGDNNTPITKLAGRVEFTITQQTPITATAMTRYNVTVKGCHLLSFLVLLDYVYGDSISYFSSLKTPALCEHTSNQQQPDIQDIRYDLISLSSLLGLSHLQECVNSTYLPSPPPTLARHIVSMLRVEEGKELDKSNGGGDVALVTKNGILVCNEIILRQRCPFFACLFDPDAAWMTGRRSLDSGPTQVNLDHHSMEIVTSLVYYLYEDPQNERELYLPSFGDAADEMMYFLIDLLGAADEFLLPPLKVLCERALIPMTNLRTVVTLLERSHLYLASSLKLACLTLIQANITSFVISGLLEHINLDLIRDLETFVSQKQQETFLHVERSPTKKAMDFSDDDDNSDLQMTLATWAKEETTIATGFMEYIETVKPTVTSQSTASSVEDNKDGQRTESESASQLESMQPKKKNKKKMIPKKDVHDLGALQHSILENDTPSLTTTKSTGWKLGAESVDESQNKLSLRDLMEKEEAQLAAVPSYLSKLPTGSSKKLSQKEKRKLQYQESKTTTVPDSTSAKTVSAWGTIPTVSSPGIITHESSIALNDHDNQAATGSSKAGPIIDDNKHKTNGNGIATKGKKIFADKEILLEEQRQGWKRADNTNIKTTVIFDPKRSFGNTFELIPVTPLPTMQASSSNSSSSSKSGFGGRQDLRRGSSSFHAIQQEQKLEDDWIKGKRKKNLVRIQKEETAMHGLRDFYIQTLGRGSGEWIDIHPSHE